MRACRTCGTELSVARLAARPDAVQCVQCLTANGDEPPVAGHMVWDHKTAPSIEIGTKLAAERPDAHPRGGYAAGYATGHSMESYDGVAVRVRAARCHPGSPAVGPSAKCPECAVEWYRRRHRG